MPRAFSFIFASVLKILFPVSSELTPESLAALRRMTGQEKLKAAFALYGSARRLKTAALKARHPGLTEEQILQKVNEIFLHGVT